MAPLRDFGGCRVPKKARRRGRKERNRISQILPGDCRAASKPLASRDSCREPPFELVQIGMGRTTAERGSVVSVAPIRRLQTKVTPGGDSRSGRLEWPTSRPLPPDPREPPRSRVGQIPGQGLRLLRTDETPPSTPGSGVVGRFRRRLFPIRTEETRSKDLRLRFRLERSSTFTRSRRSSKANKDCGLETGRASGSTPTHGPPRYGPRVYGEPPVRNRPAHGK